MFVRRAGCAARDDSVCSPYSTGLRCMRVMDDTVPVLGGWITRAG